MSVINRIEIANWLNLDTKREWNPDYRHVVLDLRGQSTAIQAHNGTGKTRMTRAILALLGRDREFTSDARAKMAPRSAPCASHIRIEVLHPLDPTQGTLLGMEHSGAERYVLGMYGYSGEGGKITFYKYNGPLDNCPVAARDGHRVKLVPDDVFRHKLRTMQGVLSDPSEEEWLLEIAKHFDRGNLRQIVEYQKKGAGDGTASFFKVKRRHGESYDEAFFFSVLAPELLVGTMGSEAIEGERRFEDTILISARKIGQALSESRRRQDELQETKNALDAIERVNVAARDVADARALYQTSCETLAGEADFLKSIVLDHPVPGIPRATTPSDEKIRAVAPHLRIQDGIWQIPDWCLGTITSEETARLNERGSRAVERGVQLNRSQVIEIPDFVSTVKQFGGTTTLYTVEQAVGLIQTVNKFASGWNKDAAIRAIHEAFKWASEVADTNFARRVVSELKVEHKTTRHNLDVSKERQTAVETELDALQARQRGMDAARYAYDRMARSGLFTDVELRAPAPTGAAAEDATRSTEKRLEEHQRRFSANSQVFDRWNAFVAEHGRDVDPGAQADEIEAAARTARERLDQARRRQKEIERDRKIVFDRIQGERDKARQIGRGLDQIAEVREHAQRYASLFPGEQITGLLERVKREYREATEAQARLNTEIEAARGPLSQLTTFRAVYPDQTAVAVSAGRSRRRDELARICPELERELADVQRRRAELERAQVAAGTVEHRILDEAGSDAVPVHAAIAKFDLPPDRYRLALTHFSGMLFAPVLDTVEEADLVAKILFEAGLAAPVLVRSELESFCRNGDIRETEGSAYSFILGARTRPVDCLLDPDFVEREKRDLEQGAGRLKDELAAAQRERAALAPNHADTRLVEAARKAEEDGLEQRIAEAGASLAEVRTGLPRLEARASEDAVAVIRATERFATLGGEVKYQALLDDQRRNKELLDGLDAQRQVADEALNAAEESVDLAEQHSSEISASLGRVPGLRELSNFIREGGPAFMQQAPKIEIEFRKLLDEARERTKFEFELAQQHVDLAEGVVAELDARIRDKSRERDELRHAITGLERALNKARDSLDEWRPREKTLDEIARRLIGQYRVAQEVMAELKFVPSAGEEISEELRRARDSSIRLEEARTDGDPHEIVERADELRGDVEDLDLRTRSKAIKEAKDRLEGYRRTLNSEIKKVLDDQSLRFSSNERERLDQARDTPQYADELFRHLEKQWQDNNRLSEAAHQALLERRAELASTLKNMTIRLQSNFDAMRKAMNWKAADSGGLDEAGIQIKAVVHNEAQTEALLNEIVEMIEGDEQYRQQEIDAGREDIIPTQEQHDEALKEKIRLRFYRGMFSEPEIRIRHPELRAGEAYRLDEKISTGQQNAVMLMLLLKLADFAIERDIRLEVRDPRARRRARALAQKVVIIDGLFSNLSNRELIKESLRAMSKVRGNFQLIGLIHAPYYQNDPEIFPNHIILSRMKQGRHGAYVYLVDGKAVPAADLGRHEGEIEPVGLLTDRLPIHKGDNGPIEPHGAVDLSSMPTK